jgi:hypothetical protein
MAVFAAVETTRWYVNSDGGVLLNLRTGRIFRMNTSGTFIWNSLIQSSGGIDAHKLAELLKQTFTLVPQQVLENDAALFLEQLTNFGVAYNDSTRPGKRLKAKQSFEQPAIGQDDCGIDKDYSDNGCPQSSAFTGAQSPSYGIAISAFLVLLMCDLALKTGGFRFMHRLLSKCPVFKNRKRNSQHVERVCKSIDVACSWYFKRILCLQRSLTGTLLLRWYGFPASMVIGARLIPFQSHAWVEVLDVVVNDIQIVKDYYDVLERC